MVLEREPVPEFKLFRPSTRYNSEYKWSQAKNCIGALEVESEPSLDLHAQYKPHLSKLIYEALFQEAQSLFIELKLKESFIQAAEAVPIVFGCFGCIRNDSKTIQDIVVQLNQTWVKETNAKLKEKNLRVDCFDWMWHHISGASESNVLMIRFFKVDDEEKTKHR